jgi:hypothetical protein
MPALGILRINSNSRFLNLTFRLHFRKQILNISSGKYAPSTLSPEAFAETRRASRPSIH